MVISHDPPDGAAGIKWDEPLPTKARLRATVMKGCSTLAEKKDFVDRPGCYHMHISAGDIEFFGQDRDVPRIYGVGVSERSLEWSHLKFFAAQLYVHNYTEADLASILAGLVRDYGDPTFVNDSLHLKQWKWPDNKVEVSLYFDPTPKPSLGGTKPPATTLTIVFERDPFARPVNAQGSDDKACNSSERQRAAAARAIRSAGYDCKTADSVCPYIFSEGFTVSCNSYRYVFEIENHGGRWSITAK